jgi:hypothetical protein
MPSVNQRLVRFATLLMMAVSLVVSAGRVVHAHVDGEHAHPLRSANDGSACHIEPVAWHAHVWLLGWEVHVPVADSDDLDSHHPPGDMSPSWSDMPTVVDVQPLATFEIQASADRVTELLVSPRMLPSLGDDCPPHSGVSPGFAQRIWMSSLTL